MSLSWDMMYSLMTLLFPPTPHPHLTNRRFDSGYVRLLGAQLWQLFSMEDIELKLGDDMEKSHSNIPTEGYDGACTLDDEDPVPGNDEQQCVTILYEEKR